MKTLAKALIQTAAFLELSSYETINPDDAVRALETLANALQSALPDELAVIRDALQELESEERLGLARGDMLKFYEQFPDNFGLTDLD